MNITRHFVVTVLVSFILILSTYSTTSAQIVCSGPFNYSIDEGETIDLIIDIRNAEPGDEFTATHGELIRIDEITLLWFYTPIDDVDGIFPVQILRNGQCATRINLDIDNVPPDAELAYDIQDLTIELTIFDVEDVPADEAAGFQYEFDCDTSDGIIDYIWYEDPDYECVYDEEGTYEIEVRVLDKDYELILENAWEHTLELSVMDSTTPSPTTPAPTTPSPTTPAPTTPSPTTPAPTTPSPTTPSPTTPAPTTPPPEITETVEPTAMETEDVTPTPVETETLEPHEGEYSYDTDGDGTPDVDDGCYWHGNEGGRGVDENGCPYYDADWDGIYDRYDECPDQADEYGTGIDSSGCPNPPPQATHAPVETQEINTQQPETSPEVPPANEPVDTPEAVVTPEGIVTGEPEVTESP